MGYNYMTIHDSTSKTGEEFLLPFTGQVEVIVYECRIEYLGNI